MSIMSMFRTARNRQIASLSLSLSLHSEGDATTAVFFLAALYSNPSSKWTLENSSAILEYNNDPELNAIRNLGEFHSLNSSSTVT